MSLTRRQTAHTPTETTPEVRPHGVPSERNPHDPHNPDPTSPMTARQTYVVACLAGHGIGPEMTAAASRALARLGREHGFDVEELHPPFDSEALTRSGHPLPVATRNATRAPTRSSSPATPRLRSTAYAPHSTSARKSRASSTTQARRRSSRRCTRPPSGWTIERAFATARARCRPARVGRRDRCLAIGASTATPTGTPGSRSSTSPLPEALRRLAAGPAGVLVAEGVLGETVAEAPRLAGQRRLVATGQLSPTGPGLFAPAQGTASDLAGQGVADPSAMLLATALLLSEGLGRTAAGEALEDSLTMALRAPRRPSEVSGAGVAATTREFVDAVLGLLPSARRDTEFALGVAR